MIKQTRFLLLGLFFLMAASGCSGCLVSHFAFHPEKVPEDLPPLNRPGVLELFLSSTDNIRIHCFYIENNSSDKVVLYLHGNAGNAYHRLNDALALSQTGTNVLLLDYRGFGKSEGSPSEDGIYDDTFSAFSFLTHEKHFDAKNIFLLGRSIGTTAAIHIAQHKTIGGLILVTPLSSGREMADIMNLGFLSWMAGSSFDNVSKAKHIISPVLVIHGDMDRITPIRMGKKVFQALPEKTKTFITVPGAGHNDLIQIAGESFWLWISEFMQNSAATEPGSDLSLTTQLNLGPF